MRGTWLRSKIKNYIQLHCEEMIKFLIHWGITAISLWVASFIFHGISFSNKQSLFISVLMQELANSIIRPVVIMLTLPLTIFTFGFFLLVINALMMLLASSLVSGFKVSGFYTAFFASVFITVMNFFVGLFIFQMSDNPIVIPTHQGIFI